MLRRNTGKLGAPNGPPQAAGPPRRPGTLRGLPNMVRRTLGETDLKSLRSSFSMSMTGLLRRGTGHTEEEAGGEGHAVEGKGGEGEAMEAMSPASTPSTVASPESPPADMAVEPGSLPLPPAKEEDKMPTSHEPSASSPEPSRRAQLKVEREGSQGDRPRKGSGEKGWLRPGDINTEGGGGDESPVPRRKSSTWSPGEPPADDGLAALLEQAEQMGKGEDGMTGTETLSRNHPIFEMLRMRKNAPDAHFLMPRSPESKDASARLQASHPTTEDAAHVLKREAAPEPSRPKVCEPAPLEAGGGGAEEKGSAATAAGQPAWAEGAKLGGEVVEAERYAEDYYYSYIDRIVLKFTTYSQSNEVSSYTIERAGGTVGRDPSNAVAVPSDNTLQGEGHALIFFKDGCFYLQNQAASHCAAVRIGVGTGARDWPLPLNCAFSVGNSIFIVEHLSEACLIVDIIDGPLKGEKRKVGKSGATLGRSPDNSLSIGDPELSRRHSKIDFDEKDGKFYLCDVGSTNGTYMQLVGPYAGTFKLTLSDQIMVGRTGFSINRFDYGISEEKGRRKSMEDHTLVIQDLGVRAMKRYGLAPQTFAAVFDGHGGEHASAYLCSHLHLNLTQALEEAFTALTQRNKGTEREPTQEELDRVVEETVVRAFIRTDEDFLVKSEHPEAGSTGTTVLIMGKRVYMCNVGDSRTVICRSGQVYVSTKDHKPCREDESRRIREAGGFIFQSRVMGELAVSRAFGDKELKKSMRDIMGPEELQQMTFRDAKSEGDVVKDYTQPLLIARPETVAVDLTDEDDFILLACDGLFDVFSNVEVVEFISNEMRAHHDSQRACENISHTAIHKRMASDNVSIVLLVLSRFHHK